MASPTIFKFDKIYILELWITNVVKRLSVALALIEHQFVEKISMIPRPMLHKYKNSPELTIQIRLLLITRKELAIISQSRRATNMSIGTL